MSVSDETEFIESTEFPNLAVVARMFDEVLVDHGYVVSVEGEPIPSVEALKTAITEDVLTNVPLANSNRKPAEGTFGNILGRVLPNLKVQEFDTVEEKKCWQKFVAVIGRHLNAGVTGVVQKRLGSRGRGEVLCRGQIEMRSGDTPGIWISTNPTANGAIAAHLEDIVTKWAKKQGAVVDWADMAVRRQPKLAKHAIRSLETHQRELETAVANFKLRALAAASGNGNEDFEAEPPDAE